MRIRIRIKGAKPMQIHADPDPGHKKLNFDMQNTFEIGDVSKNLPTKGPKPF
jgi:hypothetical protein